MVATLHYTLHCSDFFDDLKVLELQEKIITEGQFFSSSNFAFSHLKTSGKCLLAALHSTTVV